MDPFEKLPPELIHDIITLTADFVGVESLLRISPRVRAVFHAQPRIVVLDLIDANPITTMPDVQQLCRNISLIQTPSTKPADFDEYRRICENISSVLPEDLTNAEIYHILQHAARIQRLACRCLHTMQQNFIAAVEPSCAEAAGKPLLWLEEYRVYWALWHLQHYSYLRNAAMGRWGWSSESLAKLDEYTTVRGIHSSFLSEHFWTVAAVLADLGLGPPSYGHHTGTATDTKDDCSSPNEEPEWASWQYPDSTPLPFFASLDLPAHWPDAYPIWCAPPLPKDASTPPDQRAEKRLNITVPTRLYRLYSRVLSRHGQGSAYWDMMRFAPYRRLGVVFWSSYRMLEAGLLRGQSLPAAFYSAADRSRGEVGQHRMWANWLGIVGKGLPCGHSID
jgi:hypothetical protein